MRSTLTVVALLVLALSLAGCIADPVPLTAQTVERLHQQAPIRFLLTFDDGPSASGFANPSLSVLQGLAHNPLQPGIKAVFFLQTSSPRGGGSARGQRVMRRENAQGHVLGLHTATPLHTNHRSLSPEQLEQSLTLGSSTLESITGIPTTLVRPPFWNYDKRTFAAYQLHGLHVLLTDVSANDGKIWGFNASPRRRAHMLRELSEVREQIAAGQLPTVDSVIPVVVTFHDINRYTARHTEEYLQILVDSAKAAGLEVSSQPFYADTARLQRAAMARTVPSSAQAVHLPGMWGWMWNNDAE